MASILYLIAQSASKNQVLAEIQAFPTILIMPFYLFHLVASTLPQVLLPSFFLLLRRTNLGQHCPYLLLWGSSPNLFTLQARPFRSLHNRIRYGVMESRGHLAIPFIKLKLQEYFLLVSCLKESNLTLYGTSLDQANHFSFLRLRVRPIGQETRIVFT